MTRWWLFSNKDVKIGFTGLVQTEPDVSLAQLFLAGDRILMRWRNILLLVVERELQRRQEVLLNVFVLVRFMSWSCFIFLCFPIIYCALSISSCVHLCSPCLVCLSCLLFVLLLSWLSLVFSYFTFSCASCLFDYLLRPNVFHLCLFVLYFKYIPCLHMSWCPLDHCLCLVGAHGPGRLPVPSFVP